MERPNPTIEPSHAFARLFIPDRRRMILERIVMEDDSRPRRERVTSEQLSVSPPSTSRCMPGTIERGMEAQSERSLSYCTVKSLSSEHSIKDFLDTVYEKPVPTMRERISPRSTVYEADQMARTAEPSWAYRFELDQWMEEYDITEVCLQNFANFLEREGGPMADAPSTSGYGGQLSPPRANHMQPPPHLQHLQQPWQLQQMQQIPPMVDNGGQPMNGNVQQGAMMMQGRVNTIVNGGGPGIKYNNLTSTTTPQRGTIYDIITDEHVHDDKLLSSGRFERLASKLLPINPLHLIFRDHSLYVRRPVHLIFWFISLIRPRLRRVTLDGLQSKDRIRLDAALPLNHIEQLNIKQAKENPALICNEDILINWLHLPAAERSKIRVRFQNCRRLSPQGMCRFIREWQMYPEVAEFESIIVDDDSMHPWELVDEAEKDIMNYEKQDYYLRARPSDLPAYATSKSEFRTEEQAESLKRSMEFRHAKGGKAIKYYYEDGLLIFSCESPSIPRPRSPPSPSSSSSHLLIGCSSHRSSIPSRPGSLPRDNSSNSALFHSYHPPPSSPGMFGRILQILRSNA